MTSGHSGLTGSWKGIAVRPGKIVSVHHFEHCLDLAHLRKKKSGSGGGGVQWGERGTENEI